MDKNYDPKSIEAKWYHQWLGRKAFHSDSTSGGEPYCVVIPPPNVTGILHMGHALNNTIQDILARWRRMQGRNVIWMPGTDHAGIATQNVVERALKKEKISRQDLGRDDFVKRVWEWKEEYGSTIISQLKRLGASCDWDRERFTMDEGLSRAVTEVFIRLYHRKLIYRGHYIVNWCPRCHTALSDEESEHKDTNGKLYHIRYPMTGGHGPHIVVATTRPETLLGDVAVAVNPKDERYLALDQGTISLPVLGRVLKVIRDDFVDPDFGTGVVKVTPAHDPNDFMMGQRHKLNPIDVMTGSGVMNEAAGPYVGMDRFACRKKLLEDLEAQGLIEKIEDHQHAVGHCYRCDTVVEPRLSLQWFVKMAPLAKPAIEAVRSGRVQFVPDRWNKVYLEWMENIRDWCISRQIWWGHRIPVFYCAACGHEWAAAGHPSTCPVCGQASIRQDEDVLDTWFSSWLWPFSTFGWPGTNADLKYYYPTHDLVTASEIIFFWVARMIMAGCECMGDIPFRTVYIHGTVRDAQGRKMSKSLGNSIDPLTIIDQFSADALRFSLMMITATGQDVYLSNDKFEIGRNFGTKLWNAARFLQMHSEGLDTRALIADRAALDKAALRPDDLHILAKLDEAITGCDDMLGKFRFNDAAHVLYEFTWHQFCDWYVEYAKEALNGSDPARRAVVRRVAHIAFANALQLLHPFMPFITEELWHAMGYGTADEFIMHSRWPMVLSADARTALGITTEQVAYVDAKHELIRVARTLRADYGVQPVKEVALHIKPETESAGRALQSDTSSLKSILRASSIDFLIAPPTKAMPSGVSTLGTVYMPLDGLVDASAEIKRLSTQLEKAKKDAAGIQAKLANEAFTSRAPADVLQRHRDMAREAGEHCTRIEAQLSLLESLK